jgi:hypothetical protein
MIYGHYGKLYQKSPRFDPLWKSLLLHDLWTLWKTVSEESHPFPGDIKNIVKSLSFTPLQEAATGVNRQSRRFFNEKEYKGSILISGDPYIVHHQYWTNSVLTALLENLYLPVKTPLSELLFHLWTDKGSKDETGRLNLQTCADSLGELTGNLDFISPFHPVQSDITNEADSCIPGIQGGFVRYITAKGRVTDRTRERNGIIRVTSLYENGATVVSALTGKTDIPTVILKYQDSGAVINPADLDNLFFILSRS